MNDSAQLDFIDEHERAVAAPADVVWMSLLRHLRGGAGRSRVLTRILALQPGEGSREFDGRPGQAIAGFLIAASDPERRLVLRGRHRFARYELTFAIGDGVIRARTCAVFPGVRGGLYRALVIGSGGHRMVTTRMLERIAAASERRFREGAAR